MLKATSILFIAFGIGFAASAARSAEYTCFVPRALLCEGCAKELELAVQAGGACRVTFVAPSAVAPVGPTGTLELRVRVAPTAAYRPSPVFRTRRTAARAATPRQRCFVFNGGQYCE